MVTFVSTTKAAMVLPSTVWLPLMCIPKKNYVIFVFSETITPEILYIRINNSE